MLYKKYHRNYVRRFKKGAKVRYWCWIEPDPIISEVVNEEPTIIYQSQLGYRIHIGLTHRFLKIIDDRGRILRVEVINNVVQEIS